MIDVNIRNHDENIFNNKHKDLSPYNKFMKEIVKDIERRILITLEVQGYIKYDKETESYVKK